MALNGRTEKRMDGRTDRHIWLNTNQTISLRLWQRIVSKEVMYWSTHSRKNQEVESNISGPQSPSMHYLVQFHKVIVVAVSIV